MSNPAGMTVTAFPVPGENFRSRDGRVRGVTAVDCRQGVITVTYLDGDEDEYPPTNVQEVTTK